MIPTFVFFYTKVLNDGGDLQAEHLMPLLATQITYTIFLSKRNDMGNWVTERSWAAKGTQLTCKHW